MTWELQVQIRIKTLGTTDLRADDGTEISALLAQPKRFALLVYLASHAGKRLCRRDALIAMFWPESDAERARGALRKALHFIKQEAGDILITRGTEEIGVREDAVWLDANALDHLAAQGRPDEAFALYQGPFLSGFFIRGANEFDQWVDDERSRLRRRAAECGWTSANALAESGCVVDARAIAERAFSLASDDEAALRQLLQLLQRTGDRAAALSAYQTFATRMETEFGVRPSPETRALVSSIKSAQRRSDGVAEQLAEAIEAASALESRKPAPATMPPVAIDPTPLAPEAIDPRTASRPRREVWRWIAAGAAATIMIVVASLFRPSSSPASTDPEPQRITILPFAVHGTPEIGYLSEGLPVLLATHLDGTGDIRVVDPQAVFLATTARGSGPSETSPDLGAATAERFSSHMYVLGSIVGSSKNLQIEVALYDRSRGAAPITRTLVSGAESDLALLVDSVARNVLADRFRDNGGLIAETAARTTRSIDALRAWLTGEAALRAGRYEPAIASFQKAIDDDSTFAMAHYRLAVAADWAGRTTMVAPSARRAVALSSRLNPYTRSVLSAFLAARTGRYEDAEKTNRALLVERPAALETWYELAEILYHHNPTVGRSIHEADEAFEQVLRFDPHHFASLMHMARLAAARRDRDALDTLTTKALAGAPDGTHRAELLLLRIGGLDDGASRLEFLRERHDFIELDGLWRAAEYTGNLATTYEIAASMARNHPSAEMRASLQLLMAHCAMGRDEFDAASRHIDSVAVNAPDIAALTRVLLAQHPRLPGGRRAEMVDRARRALRAPRPAGARGRIYLGSHAVDDFVGVFPIYDAYLALAAGDSAPARVLVAGRDAFASNVRTAQISLMLELAVAGGASERARARESVARYDSTFANRFAGTSPIIPHALINLLLSRVLEADGMSDEAGKRFEAVPEDFGFNLAYLREVERRRSGLEHR